MLLRKLTTALVEKLLTVKKGGKLEFETGAQIRVRAPNGGAVTATVDMTELGVLDGLTATAAELNRATDISARVVTTTATVLALTVTQHAERTVLINTNSTVANTFTLPVATGSGAKMTLIVNTPQTQGSIVVAASGTLDTLTGVARIVDTTAETAGAFLTSASSDKITLNATTKGGLGGDRIEVLDGKANQWSIQADLSGSGTLETGFSQT
jgi:hypothetical protein